jgi:hypothetical protein
MNVQLAGSWQEGKRANERCTVHDGVLERHEEGSVALSRCTSTNHFIPD